MVEMTAETAKANLYQLHNALIEELKEAGDNFRTNHDKKKCMEGAIRGNGLCYCSNWSHKLGVVSMVQL